MKNREKNVENVELYFFGHEKIFFVVQLLVQVLAASTLTVTHQQCTQKGTGQVMI